MKKNFDDIMEHVFQYEGGYVDNPHDPGGATNMGITIHTMRDLALDLDNDGDIDKTDVHLVTRDLAKDIYKVNYWNAVDADSMPTGIDFILMDASVNSGPRASVRWVQRALGISADGIIGPITRSSIQQANPRDLVILALNERRKSIRQFRKYSVFGQGWENRINNVEHRALGML